MEVFRGANNRTIKRLEKRIDELVKENLRLNTEVGRLQRSEVHHDSDKKQVLGSKRKTSKKQ